MMHYQSWISLLIAQTLTLLNQHQQQIEQKAANNQRTALESISELWKLCFGFIYCISIYVGTCFIE